MVIESNRPFVDPYKQGYELGTMVYVDHTPMTGMIVGKKIDKKGRLAHYSIQMKGAWPKTIARRPSEVSSAPDYNLNLYPGHWNTNPLVITGNWRLPLPGVYHAVNHHNCPAKGVIRIIVRPDRKTATQCLGCGAQPIVVYDRGQFSYMRANPVPGRDPCYRLCDKHSNAPEHYAVCPTHLVQMKLEAMRKPNGDGWWSAVRGGNFYTHAPKELVLKLHKQVMSDIWRMQKNPGLFRELSPKEEAEFRAWARKNYVPLSPIEGLWHPVIQEECTKINREMEQLRRAGFWDKNPLQGYPLNWKRVPSVWTGGKPYFWYSVTPKGPRWVVWNRVRQVWQVTGPQEGAQRGPVFGEFDSPSQGIRFVDTIKPNPGRSMDEQRMHIRNLFFKYAKPFEKTFGVPLLDYWDRPTWIFGFEHVRFDKEFLGTDRPHKAGVNRSMRDVVEERYGPEAVKLLMDIMEIEPSKGDED